MTYLAFNFCDLQWWHVALSWLLPFLLGLLAGWAIWARYKKQVENLEEEVRSLKKRISELKADLEACHHARTELDSDVALLRGQLREKNLEISTLESSLAASKKAGTTGASSLAAGVAGAALAGGEKKKKADKKSKTSVTGSQKKGDDLKKIEGIGPKIAGLLNDEGIISYADLANSDQSSLRKILDAAGPKFQIANPGTWPEQAALARDGKWKELEALQDRLDGGVDRGSSAAAFTQKDDLKKVEGIGPKIEGLLNADGIMSFAQLADAGAERIQKILDAAGPRYRIADPTTWPDQAALARDGKWEKLEKLQDELKGGRKA